jgi:hypothetical protein
MKELIKYIVQAMVDHPEQIEVSEVEGNRVSVLELKVAKRIWGRLSASRAAMLVPSGPY